MTKGKKGIIPYHFTEAFLRHGAGFSCKHAGHRSLCQSHCLVTLHFLFITIITIGIIVVIIIMTTVTVPRKIELLYKFHGIQARFTVSKMLSMGDQNNRRLRRVILVLFITGARGIAEGLRCYALCDIGIKNCA